MKKILTILTLFFAVLLTAIPQNRIDHCDPPLWWIGMKNSELMITLHGTDLARLTPSISFPGVDIKTITRTKNPNYLFLTLDIDPKIKPGKVRIDFHNEKKKVVFSHDYELRKRDEGSAERSSFGSADVVYLLMPDRFSNGNPENDSSPLLAEKVNRDHQDGRHGGDMQGIINKLDYLHDLGITALWTTPLLEDNLPTYSYHTYAITDYFKVDGRYGTNEDYVRLADECHKRGIKLIMDMVPNHCGSDHWWMKDLPMDDWVHQFPEFTRTNYNIATWNDPHAAVSDQKLNEDGWFDVTMPDLNQDNPILLTYLKQFSIFWVEYAKLDGIRVDTYPFNDKWKIAEWTKAIRDEYPNINIMGECWKHRPSEIAYWQTGVENFDEYDSYLPTVMDFPLNDAFMAAFSAKDNPGASMFYSVYIMDYLYTDPDNILVFLDNHDTQRFSEQIDFDMDKYKLAVTHLLTTRGIPQIYTGTEIMMGGKKSNGDGDIRRDFPGGWPGDPRDAFTSAGRTDKENEAFSFMQTLLKYRKANPVIHSGNLTHFIPKDNVYVYFRKNAQKTVMVMLNLSDEQSSPDMSRFDECLQGLRKGKDIITDNIVNLNGLVIKEHSALIIEIIK